MAKLRLYNATTGIVAPARAKSLQHALPVLGHWTPASRQRAASTPASTPCTLPGLVLDLCMLAIPECTLQHSLTARAKLAAAYREVSFSYIAAVAA